MRGDPSGPQISAGVGKMKSEVRLRLSLGPEAV